MPDAASPYQLLDPLRNEEYAALKTDIAARGVLVPAEEDEDGNTLDGHHRKRIAAELGVPCPVVVRRFASEREKREHVIRINLARRHLDPVQWGKAFRVLLAEREVKSGQGSRNDRTSATVAEVAAELGVPERTVRHRVRLAARYEALPAPLKAAVDAGTKTLNRACNEAVRPPEKPEAVADASRTAGDLAALVGTGERFGCIYADPPWKYENQATRAATGNHYSSMSVDELAALPVGDLAAARSHLWLWTTNAFLFECPRLFAAWGFEFKATYCWVKPVIGIGNYLRNSHELLLLAVRGGLVGAAKDVRSWGEFPRGEHSAKPETVRVKVVERVSPGPYLELFGRKPVPGWTVFGNQIRPASLLDGDVTEVA